MAYVPLAVDYLGQLKSVPGVASQDAFGRGRVSEPGGVIDVKQVLSNAPLFLETQLTGAGTATWSQPLASTNMILTTANGDKVVRQTFQYAAYQPGRSQVAFVTGVMGAIKVNVKQQIGLFDAGNGLFFQQDGTALQVVRRTSTSGAPVDTVVDQANWSLDPLDGTGPSGITLDTSKIQVFVIDFSWLGAGGARLGVLLPGSLGSVGIVYCHQFIAANLLATVYMSTPSLPLRWSIESTGVAASGTTMVQTCGGVFSEGGQDQRGTVFSQAMTVARTVPNGTAVPIMSIRLAAAFNRATVIPLAYNGMSTAAQSWLLQVVLGGALTGAAFAAVPGGSACEVDVAATAITGGAVLGSQFATAAGARAAEGLIESAIVLASDIAGTSQILSLVLTALTGNTASYGALTWKELY